MIANEIREYDFNAVNFYDLWVLIFFYSSTLFFMAINRL